MDKSIISLQIDGYFPLSDLSLDLVAQIERLSPFGPGNPAPILATRRLNLSGYTSVGRNGEHLLLTVEDETGFERRVIWWQGAGWSVPQGQFDMAYTVRASNYRGQRDVQVEWIDHRLIEEQPIQMETPRVPPRVFDYRQEENPISLLEPLLKKESLKIWSEALTGLTFPVLDRYKLSTSCKALIVWTIPPGPAELRTILGKTSPEEVYLFGIHPGFDQPETFLKRLAGLIKHTLKTNRGNVRLSELAVASAHRIRTIHAGITWLEAHGHIIVLEQEGDQLVAQQGTNTSSGNARQTALQLKALLDETAAYRSYYLKSDQNALINL
ncbi:MAG: hypothetical protein A2029_12830 [Chloroflexi bacterium RBG_19FT_COMBO_47_9]|nr:MAG: hypothetical protein A2029_12830 [Chloroflexi bacterium RBG_19FT_COMBO_47_9]